MLICLYTTTYCCLRAATRAVLLDTTSKLLTSAKGREHVRKYLIKDKGFLEGSPASRNHCILLKYSAAVQQLSCILHHSVIIYKWDGESHYPVRMADECVSIPNPVRHGPRLSCIYWTDYISSWGTRRIFMWMSRGQHQMEQLSALV